MSALQDRRRVLGPTDGKRVLRESIEEISSKSDSSKSKIFLKSGVVVNATGSAYLETDNTKVQCAVYGPKPIRGSFIETAEISVEVEFSPFCQFSEEHGGSNELSKEVASFIESSVLHAIMAESYPKSSISVVISFISVSTDIKSSIAAAVNATGLALTDSGIYLTDIVTASSTINANQLEGIVCFALAQEESVVGCWIDSENLSLDDLNYIIDECKSGAVQVRQLLNGLVVEEFKRREKLVEKLAEEQAQ